MEFLFIYHTRYILKDVRSDILSSSSIMGFSEELDFDELADPTLVKNGPKHMVEIWMKIILMKHYSDNPKDNKLTRSDNGRSRIRAKFQFMDTNYLQVVSIKVST